MDYWRRSAVQREEAWRYLQQDLRCDIALVQEAGPPPPGASWVNRALGIYDDRSHPSKDLKWGTAVVSFGLFLSALEYTKSPFSKSPVSILRTFPGSVAVAAVNVPESSPLILISAYGLIDHGYAETTIHRILSDLTPLIDQQNGKRIVFGGDLNITTQWSAKHRSFLRGRVHQTLKRNQNVFDRLAALGFTNVVRNASPLKDCDCSGGSDCRHIRTQRHGRSSFPWQNDYLFVTEDLLDCVRRVEVVDEGEGWHLSSHFPILIDIQV